MNDLPAEKRETGMEPGEEEPRSRAEPLEEEESIEWDGSQAQLVMDDTAEYEEVQTGIKLSYVLKKKEILYGLQRAGYIRTTGVRAAVMTVVMALVSAAFVVAYQNNKNPNHLVFAVLSAILIVVILVVPWVGLNNQAKRLADGHVVNMEVYPDSIVMGSGEGKWEIPLDGSVSRIEYKNLLILDAKPDQMVILPLRCVEPAVLPEVEAMIVAGTQKQTTM